MKNSDDMSKNDEPFNPDTALNRLLEISNKITELVDSDKKDAILGGFLHQFNQVMLLI